MRRQANDTLQIETFLLIIMAAILLIVLGSSCGGDGGTVPGGGIRQKSPNDGVDWRNESVGTVAKADKVKQQTQLGITVYSNDGATAQDLADIDRAFTDEKAQAIAQGNYRIFPPFTVIDVFFPKYGCTPSPVQRIPSFKVKAPHEWDSNIYDQHYEIKFDPPRIDTYQNGPETYTVARYSEPDDVAVIFAAEMITGLSTAGSSPPRDGFVVCPGIVYDGSANGFNHIFIAHNNGGWYTETIGPDHTHRIPYKPEPPAIAGSPRKAVAMKDSVVYVPVK